MLSIEAHFLACGHGDTILLKLPGEHWCLVDCCLSKGDGTRERFFQFVEKHRIRRLEYIFQTHPDEDHYRGLVDVLDYFTRDGRSVGCYCDTGIWTKEIAPLFGAKANKYAALHDRLDQLDEAGLCNFNQVHSECRLIAPKAFREDVALVPIAPNPSLLRREKREGIRRLASDKKQREVTNALSIVLVLSIRQDDGYCNILLAADTGREQLTNALQVWCQRSDELKTEKTFKVVKVPHHGSSYSHSEELCRDYAGDEGTRVAVVSAGTRPGNPHADVLKSYLSMGWNILVTTVRKGGARSPHRLIGLAHGGLRPSVQQELTEHDIRITWNPLGGLNWEPKEALVEVGDLGFY